jgi:hypothetical protein
MSGDPSVAGHQTVSGDGSRCVHHERRLVVYVEREVSSLYSTPN